MQTCEANRDQISSYQSGGFTFAHAYEHKKPYAGAYLVHIFFRRNTIIL